MPESITDKWKAAKNKYEGITKEKKPSAKLAGAMKATLNIEKSLNEISSYTKRRKYDAATKAYKQFIVKQKAYKGILRAAKDEAYAEYKNGSTEELRKKAGVRSDQLGYLIESLQLLSAQARTVINQVDAADIVIGSVEDLRKVYKNSGKKDVLKKFCKKISLVGEFYFFQSYFAGTIAMNTGANWADYNPNGKYGLNLSNKTIQYVANAQNPWPKKWQTVFDEVSAEFIVYHAGPFRQWAIENFTDLV